MPGSSSTIKTVHRKGQPTEKTVVGAGNGVIASKPSLRPSSFIFDHASPMEKKFEYEPAR